jgi:hemolysin activation/secretion protein
VIEPLPSTSSNFAHSFTGGWDFKDFKQDVTLQGSDDLPSPARYSPFSIDYTANWLGPLDATKHGSAAVTGNRSNTSLDLGATFLVRILGGTDAAQFAAKRSGADPNFITVHPSLQRQQILPGNFSLVAKIDGQIASGPLISNEQYGIGGVDSVRGYVEAERLGDNGVHESLELRTPQLLNLDSSHITDSYMYLFTDAGHARVLDPLPGQAADFHLGSYGLGLRFKYRGLSIDLDGAKAYSLGYVTRKDADSAQFRVAYSW